MRGVFLSNVVERRGRFFRGGALRPQINPYLTSTGPPATRTETFTTSKPATTLSLFPCFSLFFPSSRCRRTGWGSGRGVLSSVRRQGNGPSGTRIAGHQPGRRSCGGGGGAEGPDKRSKGGCCCCCCCGVSDVLGPQNQDSLCIPTFARARDVTCL